MVQGVVMYANSTELIKKVRVIRAWRVLRFFKVTSVMVLIGGVM
jgi:hypothetical protein